MKKVLYVWKLIRSAHPITLELLFHDLSTMLFVCSGLIEGLMAFLRFKYLKIHVMKFQKDDRMIYLHFQLGLILFATYSLMTSGGKVHNMGIKEEASPDVVSMNVKMDQIRSEASKWISSTRNGWIFCRFKIKKNK